MRKNELAAIGNSDTFADNSIPKISIEKLESELVLFSNLIGRKISLKITPHINAACTASDLIFFNPSAEVIRGDSTARALLQHEEAHILFKSSNEVLKALKSEYPDLDKIRLKSKSPIKKTLVDIVKNILEDYRVECLWHELFPGSVRNFGMLYASVIEGLKREFIESGNSTGNPINALLIARFSLNSGISELEYYLPEEIKPIYHKFPRELRKLEGKDSAATYYVGKNVLDIIREWYKRHQENGQEADPDETLKMVIELLPLLDDELNSVGAKGVTAQDEEVSKSMTKSEEEALDESAARIREQIEKLFKDKEKIKKFAEMVRQQACDEETKAKGQSNQSADSNTAGVSVEKVKTDYTAGELGYSGPPIIPNHRIKTYMEKIRRGSQLDRLEESSDGPRINLKGMFSYSITHDPHYLERAYLRRAPPSGVEFMIMLDTSSSMAKNGKLDIAKRTIASIYDSVRGSPLVKMRIFGFYGAEDGAHVFEADRRQLMLLNSSGGTPTHAALLHLNAMIRRDKGGEEPVVMLITDGMPDDNQKTKDALVTMVRNQKVKEFTLFVSQAQEFVKNHETIINTFSGSTFYHIENMESVVPILENVIIRSISAMATKRV